MVKLWFKWSELKATFWFVPVIIIILSVVLAIGFVYVDGLVSFEQDGIARYFFVNSSDSARSILSTIAGAMMGVAGTVFSITLVALTLASTQFGPRLIKNFMYVRLNQVVLGAYISTYLYCLLVLNSVKQGDDYTFIPSISILLAILAAVANIVLLIFFIHRIATGIQADALISDISNFLSKQVETLFPEKLEESGHKDDKVDLGAALLGYKNKISIKSSTSGYLRYIDQDTLMKILVERDSIIELHFRAGGYLVQGLELGLLYTNKNPEDDELKNIQKQFVIGQTKTSQQDIEFSIYQMVEIASRALSPGINDPFTAITCIDNLTATMCYLAEAKFPSKYRFDEDKKLRIVADPVEFEGVLDAAFNQIRQFSGGSAAVIIRLMEAMNTIANFTNDTNHKKALVRHARMVLNVGNETLSEENDLEDLHERAKAILG